MMKLFDKLLFEPDRKIYTRETDYKVLPKGVEIIAGKEKLHGWWFDSQEPKAVLLQFHGNAENITSHAPYVGWLAEHGISVLCFDYSGYGKSTGTPTIAQVRIDCDAALAYARQKSIETGQPLIVFGQSIGAQFGLSALARAAGDIIPKLVILEGSFPSIRALVRSRLPGIFPLSLLSGLIANLFPDSEDASKAIPMLTTRFLIIHSSADQVVKVDLGKQVSRLIDSKLQDFWLVNGPKHLKTLTSEYPAFRQQLLARLEKELFLA